MSLAPLVFTGISKFSTDFQSIVDRAVQIAQLPMKALQNQQANIVQEKLSASNLSTAVADLAASIGTLGALGSTKALTASSSDSTKATATVTGATQGAYYSITDITSVASSASETSLKSYGPTDPVSSTGKLSLTVGSKSYTIDITSNNTLAGLRDAINGLSGAGVSASLITAAGGSYLSVSANNTGKNAISLVDDPVMGGAVSGAVAITTGVNDQLTITTDSGDDNITLDSSKTTLADVVADINAKATHATAFIAVDSSGNSHLAIKSKTTGAGASAAVSGTVITAGGDQLALSAAAAGSHGSTSVLTATNPGANTEFKLGNVAVSEPGAVISDLVAGVTFTIKGKTTPDVPTVGITLSTDRSQLSTALKDIVTKYNAVADQVNAQVGPNAGLLSGNSIIRDVRGAMMSMMNYSGGSGQIHSLAALGIELDSSGKMSFNYDGTTATSTLGLPFTSLSDAQVTDAFSFLGSATTGFGALQSKFSQISDPVSGTIKAQLDSFAATDKRITQQVSDMTDRINLMQLGLKAKLQKADSLLAMLESQQSMLTSSVQSLDYTTFGKTAGS